MKDMYALHLSGSGDTEIYLVDKEVFDWVNLNRSEPPTIIASAPFEEERGSSIDNDRALTVAWYFEQVGQHLDTFFSIQELLKFVRENDINIVDTYEGVIY